MVLPLRPARRPAPRAGARSPHCRAVRQRGRLRSVSSAAPDQLRKAARRWSPRCGRPRRRPPACRSYRGEQAEDEPLDCSSSVFFLQRDRRAPAASTPVHLADHVQTHGVVHAVDLRQGPRPGGRVMTALVRRGRTIPDGTAGCLGVHWRCSARADWHSSVHRADQPVGWSKEFATPVPQLRPVARRAAPAAPVRPTPLMRFPGGRRRNVARHQRGGATVPAVGERSRPASTRVDGRAVARCTASARPWAELAR